MGWGSVHSPVHSPPLGGFGQSGCGVSVPHQKSDRRHDIKLMHVAGNPAPEGAGFLFYKRINWCLIAYFVRSMDLLRFSFFMML